MNWMQIAQIIIMIVSLLVSVGTTVFLFVVGYMLKRRDKELEAIVTDVREQGRIQADHAVKLERLFGEVRAISDIRAELIHIRETLTDFVRSLAKIEQRLDNK